jgi:hypothetical protein
MKSLLEEVAVHCWKWLAGANMQAVTLGQINQYQSKVL